jgi:hypothetical protein
MGGDCLGGAGVKFEGEGSEEDGQFGCWLLVMLMTCPVTGKVQIYPFKKPQDAKSYGNDSHTRDKGPYWT